MDWQLPGGTESVRLARRLLQAALPEAIDEPTAERVSLAVTELVANAVRHGEAPIRLRLESRPDGLRVEVEDESPSVPRRRDPAPSEENGRGMVIVDRLAASWGWSRIEGHGKVVWCDLPAGPARA